MATYTVQLAQVEAAIAKAETGQEVTMPNNGGRIRRGELAALYAERARLTPLAAREAVGRSGPSISRGAGA
jgi:hypothetical protein